MRFLSLLVLPLGLAVFLSAGLAPKTARKGGRGGSGEPAKEAEAAPADEPRERRRRSRLERRISNIDDLRRRYFEFHNRTLEDAEIEEALRSAAERPGNSWGEVFGPELLDAARRRRLRAAGGGDERSVRRIGGGDCRRRRRRLQQTKLRDETILVSELSPAFEENAGFGRFWCASIRKITKNGKVQRSPMTLKDCEFTPEEEIAMDYRSDFKLEMIAAGSENIFVNQRSARYCIGVKRAQQSARVRVEECSFSAKRGPLQVWGLLSDDNTWRPDSGPGVCATARPRRSSTNGGGRITLKNCGADNFAAGQFWLQCLKGVDCGFDDLFGTLNCDFEAECA